MEKKNNVIISSRLLDKWADMTENNEHIEVRIKIAQHIAKHFDKSFGLYVNMFKALKKQRDAVIADKTYCIKVDWLGNECAVTNLMFEDIEKYYGKELAEQIGACL